MFAFQRDTKVAPENTLTMSLLDDTAMYSVASLTQRVEEEGIQVFSKRSDTKRSDAKRSEVENLTGSCRENTEKKEYEFDSSTMPKLSNKFKNAIQQSTSFDGGETNLSALEDMLENEKQSNKLAAWNKLDKTSRVQKLHAFAEKYGREHGLPVKEIKNLKVFFTGSLDKGRLNRAKDVVYDRESREVKSVPSLHFNNDAKAFTLRNLDDAKRVSTLKCLTPNRRTPKVTSDEDLPKVTSS